jgi:hypothetical protein
VKYLQAATFLALAVLLGWLAYGWNRFVLGHLRRVVGAPLR